MRKVLNNLALLLFIGLSLSGCSSKVRQGIVAQEEFRQRGPMFWVEPSGLYKGAVPCSDCAGIEVTLTFNANNTVEKSMRYIKPGGQTKHLKGVWVVQAGNIVQIDFSDKTPREFYKAKDGGHLVALNAKQEEEKSTAGQFNIFNQN